MQRITNAAEDHANCDVCGEPNRTGDSAVYVSESWCNRNRLTYSEGLKMCIWCRAGTVRRRKRAITMPDYEEIREKTQTIKERKERREEREQKAEEIEKKHTQATMGPLGKLAAGVFTVIDKLKWYAE